MSQPRSNPLSFRFIVTKLRVQIIVRQAKQGGGCYDNTPRQGISRLIGIYERRTNVSLSLRHPIDEKF